MFKLPEPSRGLVKSFAQACLNLRHCRPDNILAHLSQRLLSPGVIYDSSLSQLGFPTSLAPFLSENQQKSSKSRMFMKYDSPPITSWTVVAFFVKKFFENADVSPFGFFRAVGKNREWGYRKGREREELGKVPRSTKKKKNSQMENRGLKWKERRQEWKEKKKWQNGKKGEKKKRLKYKVTEDKRVNKTTVWENQFHHHGSCKNKPLFA